MSRQATIDFIDTCSVAYRREVILNTADSMSPSRFRPWKTRSFHSDWRAKATGWCFAWQARVNHTHDRILSEYLRRKFGIGYWKAFMLRWLPEKAFTDSHILPSQRWQILLLGLALLFNVLGIIWPSMFWLALSILLFFSATSLPFFAQVWRSERGVLWAVPLLHVCNDAALGCGLVAGFLFPPAARHKPGASLLIGQRLAKCAMDIAGSVSGLPGLTACYSLPPSPSN